MAARSKYTITFARSARKELHDLGPALVARILSRIEALASNPRPGGSKKLRGGGELWRIRVGDYRVIYSVDDAGKTVDVSIIRHRRAAYQ